jgi:hypothetical protein
MFHLSYKDWLFIKIDSKYFLSVVDFDFSYSDVDFFVKLKSSKPDPVIEMIKLCHTIQIAIDQEIQTNEYEDSSKEKILFERRH